MIVESRASFISQKVSRRLSFIDERNTKGENMGLVGQFFIFGALCPPCPILWVSVGQYFIFGALCPSKSGLMNKHIVKHIYPSKSGLMNKHIVKHTIYVRTNEQTYRETYRGSHGHADSCLIFRALTRPSVDSYTNIS